VESAAVAAAAQNCAGASSSRRPGSLSQLPDSRRQERVQHAARHGPVRHVSLERRRVPDRATRDRKRSPQGERARDVPPVRGRVVGGLWLCAQPSRTVGHMPSYADPAEALKAVGLEE
jgi:hypothetical protein